MSPSLRGRARQHRSQKLETSGRLRAANARGRRVCLDASDHQGMCLTQSSHYEGDRADSGLPNRTSMDIMQVETHMISGIFLVGDEPASRNGPPWKTACVSGQGRRCGGSRSGHPGGAPFRWSTSLRIPRASRSGRTAGARRDGRSFGAVRGNIRRGADRSLHRVSFRGPGMPERQISRCPRGRCVAPQAPETSYARSLDRPSGGSLVA